MECLTHLAKHVNRCEVRRENYTLPELLQTSANAADADDVEYAYPALREPAFFTEPVQCTWALMSEPEVMAMMRKRNLDAVRAILGKRLAELGGGYPKGLPRMIALELLYGGYKFAKSSNYNAMQTGALLSMLYMTLRYFNSSHRTTAEDVFWFFKELLCYHSLDFVPTHQLVYTPTEANLLLSYFCKIFLRHLPIIRLLGLPNFEFAVNTYIPPFPKFKKAKPKKEEKPKGKKEKKPKKDKKKKK